MALRPGFSLPEALAALTLTSLAASALLLSSYAALQQTVSSRDCALAHGLAQQVLDEVLEHPLTVRPALVAALPDFTAAVSAVHADARTEFTKLDDFDGYRTWAPVRDRFGHPWGRGQSNGSVRHPDFALPADFFTAWQIDVRVQPVALADLTQEVADASTTDLRRVEVTVSRQVAGAAIELAKVQRVVAEMTP